MTDRDRELRQLARDILDREGLSPRIADTLATLSPREAQLVRLRFGFTDDRKAHSRREIAYRFARTETLVRQIENHALIKLGEVFVAEQATR